MNPTLENQHFSSGLIIDVIYFIFIIFQNCCSLKYINCKVSDRGNLPPYLHSTASSEIHMNSIRPTMHDIDNNITNNETITNQ